MTGLSNVALRIPALGGHIHLCTASMLIRYQSDPDEGIQAVTAAARAVTPNWAGLPTLAATVLFIAAFARITRHNWGEIVVFTVIAFGALQLFGKLERYFRWTRAIEADPHSAEIQEVEVSDGGLTFSCEHARSELTWSGVRRVQETSDHYLFVCGALGACTVPKRAMSNADDDELRNLIRMHSPDRGVHLAREVRSSAPVT